MFERTADCPRCKRQITLGFWNYSLDQGYQHVYCPHCGGESKFGLKARIAGLVALALGLSLGYIGSFFVNSYISFLAAGLALPILFAALSRPFVSLEPTDAGLRLKRMQPFFIFMAVLVLALAVLRTFGVQT